MLLVQAKNDDEQFLLIKISGGEYKKWLNNNLPPPNEGPSFFFLVKGWAEGYSLRFLLKFDVIIMFPMCSHQ
jgi:hypothetical protein